MPRLAAVIVSAILSEQIDDIAAIGTHPCPQPAGLGVLGLAVMAEVLIQRRHTLTQLQREPLMEIIIWGNAMRNGFCAAQQDVAAQFVDHDLPP